MFKGSVYGKNLPNSINSLIADLQSPESEINLEACGRFASVYFDPLVGYLLRSGKFFGNREEAKDLVSEFIFKRLIEKRIVQGFDPNYGGQKRKFRHYLCRSLLWLYQDGQKSQSPIRDLADEEQQVKDFREPDNYELDDNVYEYVLAANLLIQSFIAVKTDCLKKNQKEMWEVFAIRVIKQSLTGKKEKHADIAKQLGLESAKRSSHLLESGLQKFKSFANRIIKEAEPGLERRTPEELLKILAKPPIPNFDLFEHLEDLAKLSQEEGEIDNEVFLLKTGEELSAAAESWLNDREVEPRDPSELCWQQILNQTLNQYQDFEQNLESSLLSVSAMMSGSDEALFELLFQPTTHLGALRDVRKASKNALNQCQNSLDSAMHRTVYALVHASDIVNHKACTSKSGPKSIMSIIESSLKKQWLDEQSRWQLQTAAKLLREEQILFPRVPV